LINGLRYKLAGEGIFLSYRKVCCGSLWLEIRIA